VTVAALIIALITLVFAVLIHSQTREVLNHINTITYTLPGAYDIERLKKDIEKTGEIRGKVVCITSKHTHIAFGDFTRVSWKINIINAVWRFVHRIADWFAGNIEIPIEMTRKVKWEITSGLIESQDVDKYLSEGWEPFSAASDGTVWLRKEMIKQD
jgi:hypothetical protein